jgi:hypothetical protein
VLGEISAGFFAQNRHQEKPSKDIMRSLSLILRNENRHRLRSHSGARAGSAASHDEPQQEGVLEWFHGNLRARHKFHRRRLRNDQFCSFLWDVFVFP